MDGRTDGQTKYSNPPAHAPRVNDVSEGAETMNKSNLFQILEYIYELVREKGTHKVRECEWYERVLLKVKTSDIYILLMILYRRQRQASSLRLSRELILTTSRRAS